MEFDVQLVTGIDIKQSFYEDNILGQEQQMITKTKLLLTSTLVSAILIFPQEKAFAVELKAQPPLVGKKEDAAKGNFSPAPNTDKLRKDYLIPLSKAAFLRRKKDSTEQELIKPLLDKGWTLEDIKGMTGLDNSVADAPGFVATHQDSGLIIITYRGSDSTVPGTGGLAALNDAQFQKLMKNMKVETPTKGEGKLSADWEVNFDAEMIETTSKVDPKIKTGKMHKGFSTKAKASLDSLFKIIDAKLKSMDADSKGKLNKQGLQIWITGHSQGAALAPIAAAELARHFQKNSKALGLGDTFDNTKTNTIKVYAFSGPRFLGNAEAETAFNNALGKENVIIQNVVGKHFGIGDPVTIASPGKTTTAALKLIPLIGPDLANKYGGGEGAISAGYLAADFTSDVATTFTIKEIGPLILATADDLYEIAKLALSKNNPIENVKKASEIGQGMMLRFVLVGLAPLHYGCIQTKKESQEHKGLYSCAATMERAPASLQLLKQGAEYKSKYAGKELVSRMFEAIAKPFGAINKKTAEGLKDISGAIETNLNTLGKEYSPQTEDGKAINLTIKSIEDGVQQKLKRSTPIKIGEKAPNLEEKKEVTKADDKSTTQQKRQRSKPVTVSKNSPKLEDKQETTKGDEKKTEPQKQRPRSKSLVINPKSTG